MTLTLQQISDRLEIAETVTRYSYGLDQRRWEEWDLAFLPDSVIDFSTWGLAPATPAELRALFSAGDDRRISGQHLLSNQVIRLDGDTARSHVEFTLCTLARSDREGHASRNQGGGWYEDELRRTPAGWRIVHRRGFHKWGVQDEIPWQPAG